MIRPASLVPVLLVLAGLALVPAPAEAAKRRTPVTPSGWAIRPAGAQISVARSSQGFQGPLGSALSPSGQKLLSVSSAATRINSADLFDLRRGRRTGTVSYDSRRGMGEAVFYGVTFSPGGKRAWASGGGQNVVHVYDGRQGPARDRHDPGAELPGRARLRQDASRRPHLRRQQPLRPGRRVQPAGALGHRHRPEDQPRDRDDRSRPGAAALRRHVQPQGEQGLRDELDGPVRLGHRHPHGDACGGGSCSPRRATRCRPTTRMPSRPTRAATRSTRRTATPTPSRSSTRAATG